MTNAAQRLDKWLWFARIVKSRTLATALVSSGRVRVNARRVSRPSRMVRAGDVITAAIHGRVRVLKIVGPGSRRGPASEAQALYDDISPPAPPRGPRPLPFDAPAHRERGAGRPTKRDRRRIDAWTANPE
ncbi:MAG: RNA-binding S4 domain-containing protein [Hyphomicrobiales bacterium]|nr:RNA-binding S4 domain-containing protein [Hyphomicrobiales bacterium]